jgi:glycosyltransferase involved in cell wall biosynthesis
MRRIVFAMQSLDPSVEILASFIPVVDELATRVDEVAVIADHGLVTGRPGNVTLRTFGASSRPQRLARFVRAVRAELSRGADAFVAHQIPIFAVVAAPVARRYRVPILLWYAHPSSHRTLQAAERVSTLVLSTDRRTFPLPSTKVRAIGQAVETSLLAPIPEHGEAGRVRAISLGRYSAVKGMPAVIEAVAATRSAGVDVDFSVHGSAAPGPEQEHRASLEALVRRLGLAEHVDLDGPVARTDLPALFERSDVLVNNTVPGSSDKATYEAAYSCLPVLASNPVYDGLVSGIEPSLLFAPDDVGELAERLAAIAALTPARRREIGGVLRERVETGHSVRSWVDGLLAAVAEARQ